MTVLDASCLISFFLGEPGKDDVVELLMASTEMSVLNRAEVIDRLGRGGADPAVVAADLDMLGLSFLDVTADIGDHAARLRARHYHRTTLPISMSDCVAAATALRSRSPLATSDSALATLVERSGGRVVPVRNSAGERPR